MSNETTVHRVPCTYWHGDDMGSVEDGHLEVSIAAENEIAVELGAEGAIPVTQWVTARSARQLGRALLAAAEEHDELYPGGPS